MGDDSFVVLAELESHLRLELHAKARFHYESTTVFSPTQETGMPSNNMTAYNFSRVTKDPYGFPGAERLSHDPLIYWGYLGTDRLHKFMARELYALSRSAVDWIHKEPTMKGVADKQTSKWMRMHPRASKVPWVSERCWIYMTTRTLGLCMFHA